MFKKLLIVSLLGMVMFSTIAVGNQINENPVQPVHRGSFQAEIGVKESNEADFSIDGNFRDFRGRHILFGTISPIDSDRTLRFQGLSSRNLFIIQTGLRNQIVNIFGRFNEYDETENEYSGNWIGFIAGVGRTSGWITAQYSS